MEYCLWSAALGGWMTRASTYSSVFSQARRFTRDEALDFCRIHVHNDAFGMIPVRVDDLEEVKNDKR